MGYQKSVPALNVMFVCFIYTTSPPLLMKLPLTLHVQHSLFVYDNQSPYTPVALKICAVDVTSWDLALKIYAVDVTSWDLALTISP